MNSKRFLIAAAVAAALAAPEVLAREIKLINAAQPDATDIAALVASLTKGCKDDQEKMIALWGYIARNKFFHWAEAREGPEETTELGLVYDPIIAFNVHGTLICYQVADLLGNLADAAGIKPRHLQVPGHRVMETFYGGSWHFFDATYDCAAYFLNEAGGVISLDDLCKDAPKYLNNSKCQSDPCYQFDKYGGKFWPWESKKFVIEKMFLPETPAKMDHYATKIARGHTMGLELRRGEKLIRNWSNEGKWYCSAALYKQWHGDPTQQWIDKGPHDPRDPQTTYVNGTLSYAPDWSNPANYEDGVYDSKDVKLEGGKVQPTGPGGFVTFGVRTPYLIAGKPGKLDVDGDSAGGAVVEAELSRDPAAQIALEVSTDNGLTWRSLPQNEKTGSFNISSDLTNWVEGTYGYLLRFRFGGEGAASIAKLKLTTSLFMSAVPLPAVRAGENRFAFNMDEGAAGTTARTDLSSQASAGRHFAKLTNLKWNQAFPQHLAVQNSSQDGEAIMELTGPAGAKLERAGVHVSLGARPTDKTDLAEAFVAASPDGPWQAVWKGDFADKNDHWRWDRSFDFAMKEPAAKAYLKLVLHPRVAVSLNLVRVNAHWRRPERPMADGAVKITHAWTEDGAAKSLSVQPKAAGQTYTITAAGKDVKNQSVTIELENQK